MEESGREEKKTDNLTGSSNVDILEEKGFFR